MKKLTALMTALLLLGALAAPMTAVSAEGLPEEGVTQEEECTEVVSGCLTYSLYSDHARVIRCNTDETEVVVPDRIEGRPVTEIGEAAFQGCTSLTAVALPETINAVGDYAFDGTALETVYWEGDAYAWDSVALPDNEDPFHYADHLVNYLRYETTADYTTGFQNGMAYEKYSDHVEIFQLDYGSSEITIPAQIEGLPVTSVNGFCDYNPVGGAYYYNHALQKLTIPETVTKLGITGCNELETILVDANNPAFTAVDGNLLFSKDMTVLYHYPACRGETSFTVPDSVTAIGGGAFAGCKDLQEIVLPEGLRSIGRAAFMECTSLTDITLPEGLTELGDAFIRCYKLPYLELPKSVTDLSDFSMFFCESLKTLVVPSTVTVFTDATDSFGEPGLTDIYFGGTQQEWEALLSTFTNSFDTPFEGVTVHCDFKGFSVANLNGDERVDANDAAQLLKAAAYAGIGDDTVLNVRQKAFADLNSDNTFDANDAALILRYAAYAGTGGTDTIEAFLANIE